MKLSSWKNAQAQVGKILEHLNSHQVLVLASASKPLLGLDERCEIDPKVRQEFEDRIRFGNCCGSPLVFTKISL